jgi:hypothetical protein
MAAAFVTSLVVGSYFWIRASLNRRRPSQRWFVHTNPLNAVLFEDELTPQGLRYRTKAFRALLIALISIVIFNLLCGS